MLGLLLYFLRYCTEVVLYRTPCWGFYSTSVLYQLLAGVITQLSSVLYQSSTEPLPHWESLRQCQSLQRVGLTSTLAVRRGELRFKNHHPDPRTSRYGQRLEEEILGCRMSGWLTPKLERNRKLQALPCARLTGLEAGRDRTPGFKPSPRPQNTSLGWVWSGWRGRPSRRATPDFRLDAACSTSPRAPLKTGFSSHQAGFVFRPPP